MSRKMKTSAGLKYVAIPTIHKTATHTGRSNNCRHCLAFNTHLDN